MDNLREKKQEKIDGKFYDMSPAADYRHSLVNGNIFYRLRGQFQDSLCAIFMKIWIFAIVRIQKTLWSLISCSSATERI